MTIVEMARFAMKSSTGAHDAPPVVVLNSRPAPTPTNITARSVGSITSDRTRPPVVPGPSHVQVLLPDAPAVPAAGTSGPGPLASPSTTDVAGARLAPGVRRRITRERARIASACA